MSKSIERSAGALPAPRVVAGEVARAGEQPATVVQLTGDQFRALLDRASRPVILRGPEQYPTPYAAPAAGDGHPGINVTLPSSGAGGYYVVPTNVGPLETTVTETRTWAPLLFIASAASFLGGPPVAIMTGSDLVAAILCAVGFAGGCRSLMILMRNG
jgi:hypothetical protein